MDSEKIDKYSDSLFYASELLREVANESDRARAILAGAELDIALLRIIEKFLIPTKSKNDPLLEVDGPLSNFSSRIEMAYRLGLIPPSYQHDLNIIRKIRNKFAHGPKGLSFEDQSIKDLCQTFKLTTKNIYKSVKDRVIIDEFTKSDIITKNLFIEAFFTLVIVLSALQHSVKQIEGQWKGIITDFD